MSRFGLSGAISCLLALVLSLGGSGAALGQSKASLAKDHLELGNKAYKAERYQDAVDALLKAAKYGDMIKKRDRLHYNIGMCLERLGRLAEAVKHFERALEFVKKPAHRARVQKRIDALIPKAFGAVEVACVENAKVSVANLAPKPCPATWSRVPVGTHEVHAQTGDGLAAKANVTVVASEKVKTHLVIPGGLDIPFSVRPPPEASSRAWADDAIVLLDGAPWGVPPIKIDVLSPGMHLVALRLPGKQDATARIRVESGQRLTLSMSDFSGLSELFARPVDYTPWAWTALALGVASVGAGAAIHLSGSDAEDAWCVEYRCDETGDIQVADALRSRAQDEQSAYERDQIIGQTLMGIGAGLLVTSAYLLLRDDDALPSGSSVQLAPSRDGAVVVWWGTW